MRYSAAEKGEIIRLVENSSLSVKKDLGEIGYSQVHILQLAKALSG